MFKTNSKIKDAVVAMQSAIESGDQKVIADAFEQFGDSIATTVQAEYEAANGDKTALLQRGFRVLTSEEKKFYETVIEAGKQKTVQSMNGLLTGAVMPNTVIEDVYRNLVAEHPLLSRVQFTSVQYLTRWILNDHTADSAVWGEITDEITKEVTSAFKTIELAQNKLSAFAVIEKSVLELGPVFLDGYIRAFLTEALAKALEKAIIFGNGINSPIGLDRDIHEGVSFSTTTGYPQKTAVALKSLMPEDYGKVLATLAKTEKGLDRVFNKVTFICNPSDYFNKIMPATSVLAASGTYANDVFPFPTDVIKSAEVEEGKAIICLPEEYFIGVGAGKDGSIEYSDDYKFLEDARTFKIKMYGNGRAVDNTAAVLVDISALAPTYVTVKQITEA